MLAAFVDAEGNRLADADIVCFEAILELPDPTLHAYLLGRSAPEDAATAALIDRIRASHRPHA